MSSSSSHAQSDYMAEHQCIDGILYPPFVYKDHIEKLKSFQRRPEDAFIVCYPKSGTHWLMKIVYLILHNGDDKYIHTTPSRDEVVWIEEIGKEGHERPLEDIPSPRVFASHAYFRNTAGGPPSSSPAKYIYCARNPKDVVVAFYHHHIKRKKNDDLDFNLSWDEFFQHFLRGDVTFGCWWDHVPEWWAHRDDPNVLFLKYEDLKKDLLSYVKTIADFLGCSLDQETIEKIAKATTIDSMKANTAVWKDQHFLRKGIVGDWKNHLTPAQSDKIDSLCEKLFQDYGLKFEFD